MSLLHWVWLGLALPPGSRLIDEILRQFQGPEEFFLAGEAGIAQIGRISRADALYIRNTELSDAEFLPLAPSDAKKENAEEKM